MFCTAVDLSKLLKCSVKDPWVFCKLKIAGQPENFVKCFKKVIFQNTSVGYFSVFLFLYTQVLSKNEKILFEISELFMNSCCSESDPPVNGLLKG